MRLRLLLPPLFILFTTLSSNAADTVGRDLNAELVTANELLQQREYPRAYAELLRFADRNQLAQFSLGLIEEYGWGRPADPIAACGWFEKAAAQDIPMAQQMLGDCYQQGIHAPASFTQAELWYTRAVGNGLVTGNFKLGRMLIDGELTEPQLRRGTRLCEQAAEKGSIEAQLYLAHSFHHGVSLKQDLSRAVYWYHAAATGNNPEALYQLGLLMRDGYVADISREQSLKMLERAAELGQEEAYLATAEMYFSAPVDAGTQMPTETNLAKAYMWLQAVLRVSEREQDRSSAEAMLAAIARVMPASWKGDLDFEVDEHFSRLDKTPGKIPDA
jgi:TPR repeat protein